MQTGSSLMKKLTTFLTIFHSTHRTVGHFQTPAIFMHFRRVQTRYFFLPIVTVSHLMHGPHTMHFTVTCGVTRPLGWAVDAFLQAWCLVQRNGLKLRLVVLQRRMFKPYH